MQQRRGAASVVMEAAWHVSNSRGCVTFLESKTDRATKIFALPKFRKDNRFEWPSARQQVVLVRILS